jgi:transcriptional regulator with XRE-family HTH domain
MSGKKDAIKIGETLTKLARDRKLSLREIAKGTTELTGEPVSISTLHDWTLNRSPKNIHKVKCVASFFQVSLHFLVYGVDEQKPLIQTEEKINSISELWSGSYEIVLKIRKSDGK